MESIEEIFADFSKLFSRYVGKIEKKETDSVYYRYEITITNVNRLITKRTDGSVFKDRPVKCSVTVEYDKEDNYGVMAEESTYEILGGSSVGQMNKDEAMERAKRELIKYNFIQKNDEQLSLF